MHRPGHLLRRTLAPLVILSCVPLAPFAAEIYVLDARIEREGRSSASPTFIVTPGERALLAFGSERDLEVAMTLTPRSAATEDGERFDLKVELVDGVQLESTTVPVALAETETLELGGRTIDVLIRVQEPLGQPTDAQATNAPAADAVPADDAAGADGN